MQKNALLFMGHQKSYIYILVSIIFNIADSIKRFKKKIRQYRQKEPGTSNTANRLVFHKIKSILNIWQALAKVD